MSDDTDRDWEWFGSTDPYWAVFTEDRFRKANLSSESLVVFYASGVEYVDRMLSTVRSQLDAGFNPSRALDFGCGVGRVTIPLAERCPDVVGVDVSVSMLREARAQAQARGLTNVSWVQGDDQLTAVDGLFDLVHSYIVFQHIPGERGERLFRRLLELLSEGGIGVLHFTYAKATLGSDQFNPPTPPVVKSKRWSLRRRTAPVVEGTPRMQMNSYPLNPIFHHLQLSGVRRMLVEFSDHGGELGVRLFFQKIPKEAYRA
jgi:ubiquinone/menaquinone biosynthesis C-methylase UbiE